MNKHRVEVCLQVVAHLLRMLIPGICTWKEAQCPLPAASLGLPSAECLDQATWIVVLEGPWGPQVLAYLFRTVWAALRCNGVTLWSGVAPSLQSNLDARRASRGVANPLEPLPRRRTYSWTWRTAMTWARMHS